jgi:hypothetical protein
MTDGIDYAEKRSRGEPRRLRRATIETVTESESGTQDSTEYHVSTDSNNSVLEYCPHNSGGLHREHYGLFGGRSYKTGTVAHAAPLCSRLYLQLD